MPCMASPVETLFGTAFIQGERLQFTTAMPVQKLVTLAARDRSAKKDGVIEVMEHSNRPKEPAHGKHIRDYLLTTACSGDKFILPNFTLNYGVGLDDEAPTVTLILFAPPGEGSNAWAAILLLPNGTLLDITDGAHREGEIQALLDAADKKVTNEQKRLLKRNAVDVKIVFESNRADSHQDFADCAKAKPITKSLVATFDVRDGRNRRTRDLVRAVPFLTKNVDATASNVNLTAKSAKIWSMSAARMFVGHVINSHFAAEGMTFGLDQAAEQREAELEATDGSEEFFTAVILYHPQLKQLANDAGNVTTAQLREAYGGNVALRGVGMAVLARAFRYCKEHGVSYDDMAKVLGTINWYVLDCERDQLVPAKKDEGDKSEGEREMEDNPEIFAAAVRAHANKLWAPLIAIGHNKYKLASSSTDVDRVWDQIARELPGRLANKAA